MIYLLFKSILHGRFSIRTSPAHKFNEYHLQSPWLFDHKCFSSNANQPSFVASHSLNLNKCGFSPDNSDAVLAFLKSHGFSERQISKLIKNSPRLLELKPEKTLLPKLEFLYSKGASQLDVARRCSGHYGFLDRSLEKQIIPSFDFFRGLLQSDERVIKAISRHPSMIRTHLWKFVASNVDTLTKIGVPKSNIASLICSRPSCVTLNASRFSSIVQKVKNMGFNPLRCSFVFAASVFGSLSETTWGRKIDAYRKWGMSQEEILTAFCKHPSFMNVSEDKIAAVMNVYVNQLGVKPAVIAKNPSLLSLSLQKRIVPRASVAKALVSKGFLRKDLGMVGFFSTTEEKFLEKYIIPYEGEGSQLLKLYKEKLNSP